MTPSLSANIAISGEQGKVDESMREMAAIEALKSEKSEKEVHFFSFYYLISLLIHHYSESFNN